VVLIVLLRLFINTIKCGLCCLPYPRMKCRLYSTSIHSHNSQIINAKDFREVCLQIRCALRCSPCLHRKYAFSLFSLSCCLPNHCRKQCPLAIYYFMTTNISNLARKKETGFGEHEFTAFMLIPNCQNREYVSCLNGIRATAAETL